MQRPFAPAWALALFYWLITLPGAAQPPAPREPVMFRGDARHSGRYQSPAFNGFEGVQWAFKTGGKVFSSPAVAEGVAYFGSEDKHLYAVDARSGRAIWKFATGGAVHASPAVFRGTVYFTSFDGYCYALDARTGREKWRFQTDGEQYFGGVGLWDMTPVDQYHNDIWDIFVSSPAIDPDLEGGVLYFGTGSGHLYALDLATGGLKWKFKTDGVVHSSPALAYGMVYFGSWDTYLYALDARTGGLKWKFKTENIHDAMRGIQASPLVYDGKVFFGARDAHFYALDAFTGQEQWKYFADWAWILSSAAAYKGTVYVGTSDSNGLLAFDARTGEVKYTFDTQTYLYSSPAIAGGTAYFGNFTGTMFALDLQSEGKKWAEFQLEASKQNSYRVVNEQGRIDWANVILPGKDGMDYANNVWGINQIYSTGSIVSSPVVADGMVYFGSADGSLYALRLGHQKAPSVALTLPAGGTVFATHAPIALEAVVKDNPGPVQNVEFYANSRKIGETRTAPYRISWQAPAEGAYTLRAKATGAEGQKSTSSDVLIEVAAAPARAGDDPVALSIGAFPNPFGAVTTLQFTLPQDGHALLTLEGKAGKKRVLLDKYLKAGTHQVTYDGSSLGRDVYVCRLSCNGKTTSKKIMRQ
jgi:outer membrane protein assembly factor BamB